MTIPTESETWTVPVGDTTTTAIFDPASESGGRTVVVFGHGASSHLAHPTVTRFCEILRSVGLHTVRYNFLYTEHKKGPPDRMPRLTECLDAVVRTGPTITEAFSGIRSGTIAQFFRPPMSKLPA